tara:strand:- start:290 stop:493 length:204 start_codon:yes stop_codon:yes gene_type:complete
MIQKRYYAPTPSATTSVLLSEILESNGAIHATQREWIVSREGKERFGGNKSSLINIGRLQSYKQHNR